MKYYLKYALKNSLLFEILDKLSKKRINFFIDVQGICKGFYNKDVIEVELGRYITDGKPSDILIEELRGFLNNIYQQFKKHDPFFVLFYDDGFNAQQKAIANSYKSGISTLNLILPDEQELQLYRQIRKYYFQKIVDVFTKPNLSKVFYLREYESDCIPHYCIMNNIFESREHDVLNVLLAVDKDLLQTTKFENTIQHITYFKKVENNRYQLDFKIYDKDNAITHFNPNFKRGILTADYIPLLLAISGDKSDNISGIKGMGYAKAYKLIVNYKLPPKLFELKANFTNLPDIVKQNFELIENNIKLIDFEEQIQRIPMRVLI